MNLIGLSSDISNFKYALLIKDTALERPQLKKYYGDPLSERGLPTEQLAIIGLPYADNNRVPAKEGRQTLIQTFQNLQRLGITDILIADTHYFKLATGKTNTGEQLGNVLKPKFDEFNEFNIVLSINYQALYYNDAQAIPLNNSLDTFSALMTNTYSETGKDIIHSEYYPKELFQVEETLNALHQYPRLTCDIETFSLRFYEAGLGTIAFAWDKHNGVAISVEHGLHLNKYAENVRTLLKQFFENYEGRLIFHNALFDVKVLIYQLFMNHPHDIQGMRYGLNVFRDSIDTLVLTFIATNTTAGNNLKLKHQALEFAGNYAIDAEEIKDIQSIPPAQLLSYNLIDCLSTWYVFEKYAPVVQNTPSLAQFYKDIAQPSLGPTIKMMLVGLPINMDTVDRIIREIKVVNLQAKAAVLNHPATFESSLLIKGKKAREANVKLKKKFKLLSDFDFTFNPGSNSQIQVLLYDVLKLPVLGKTKKKAPSTSSNTLKRLLELDLDPSIKDLLRHLIEIGETNIILDNFLKKFKELAFDKGDTQPEFWINGNLKSCGTQGGRYSSTDPNMQNNPEHSTWGHAVKECFEAPEEWIFGAADFSSLEDRINAILTQDPNKIKVYTDGYDGHCLRAHSYFGEDMEDIDSSVGSINSIATKYPELRQNSKTPTFALTYEGTWITLVKNLGLSKEEAQRIETNYHQLYQVSDQFTKRNIEKASKDGYVELAFGLRLKTPILHRTVLNTKVTPYEAEKEGRSANNAITQSWGMLTNRAVIEFEKRLEQSPFYEDVLICNVIHDAIYVLIRRKAEVVYWVNINLIECMEWNDHPLIKSTDVPMKADLAIGPNLDNKTHVQNHATIEEIEGILESS